MWRDSEILRLWLESTAVSTALLDPQFNFIRVNRAYAAAGGQSPDWFIGQSHFVVYPSNAITIFEEVRRSKKPFEVQARPFEYTDQPQRGTTYWDWKLEPLLDEDGELSALLLTLIDVTERYRSHLDNSVSGVAILRRDWTVQDGNAVLSKLLGRPHEALRGKPVFELIHPADRERLSAAVQVHDFSTHGTWTGRTRLASKLSEGHALVTIRCVFGNTDEPDYFVLHAQDLTTEFQVQKQKQRYFDLSIDMFCIADFDGYFRELNSAWETTLGFTKEELLGQRFVELVHPDDRERTIAESSKLATQPTTSRQFNNRYRTKDGGWRWLMWNAVNHPDTREIFAVAHDITALKTYEEELLTHHNQLEQLVAERTQALHAQEVRTHDLLSLGPAVLYACEASGDFGATYVSPNVVTILGHAPERFTEKASFWADQMHPEDRDRIFRDLGNLLEHGKHVHEYRFRHADGHYLWMRDELRLVRSTDGTPLEIIGYWIDITARRTNEDLLRKAKRTADEANQAKSEFLSRMSHELRTPLNAILGFSEFLQLDDAELNDRQRRGLSLIHQAGRHLLTLIDGVLQLAKIDAGKEDLVVEAVDVRDLIEQSFSLVQPLASKRSIRLDMSIREPLYVNADSIRLKQIFVNLLSNAIKYNREHGSVLVDAKVLEDDLAQVRVRDTGVGVADAELNKLFEPFYRVSATTSQAEGSGIGLSICRRLAELMDGRIGVESHHGEGSTFWVELPRAVTPRLRSIPPKGVGGLDEDDKAQLAKKAVLYVEDHGANRRLMQMVFEGFLGAELLLATTGEEGIELARSKRPDLILMDLDLPGIDGYQAAQILLEDPLTRSIPIVAMSAHAMNHHLERAQTIGFHDYVTKPISVTRISETIRRLLVS